MTTPGFGTQLFLGRLRADLLTPPPGDPRRLGESDEQFLVALREFCDKHVDSHLIERDDRIPDQVIDGLKQLGAFAMKIPREYGGLGLSGRCYLRALMIVNSTHSALGELLAAHQAIGLPQPVLLFGTDAQKRAFLPRCTREISAFALTEPDIGNDPFRMHTTAVAGAAGDSYTLNGVKLWTTNGTIADLLVVMAMVTPAGDRAGGMTVFVVEAGSPGVTVEHRSSFMGLRGLENGVIRLYNVVVPAANRIGGEGEGLTVALAAQETGRLSLPAVCAGAAKWSLKIARQWTSVRVQWGRPIGEHDAVAGKLAYIAATAFALEAMTEITGRLADLGADTSLDAELAKLFASEHTWRVADDLMQLRGGRGYETAESSAARGERGVPVERLLRDLRIGRIFDGSTEALRGFIADAVITHHQQATGTEIAPSGSAVLQTLATHVSFAEQTARRIADAFAGLARSDEDLSTHQLRLGRLIEAGAELYAMTAACAYATALAGNDDTAIALADTFCRQARLRVAHHFTRMDDNTDTEDRTLARTVLAGDLTWLEEGVTDPSIDGPWIAQPQPGPSNRPDLRRAAHPTIGRRTDDDRRR
ncbi:acyl-CoA dehydrogenase family protein [Actinoplanes solisilvae]|uniref:acyl-CoA dehydrogenase family protein n=1 Tax=Actinoplanes solisilvae TaxID=2486853 RepID=UPI00196B1693|nr:acyl-CoA dehydrogenase family protein [Actinoplanes solisilvae]